MIYLDYNATTPVAGRVFEAMRPWFLTKFGNPSSMHALGREARAAVEKAREYVAALIGAAPEEIVFTSGGTESNNLALLGAALPRGRGHVVISAVEHPAVREPARYLESIGYAISLVGVDGQGRVSVEDVETGLRNDTILVSIMHANNEVGSLQPISEIGEMLKDRGIVFHTDAAQSAGKVPLDVRRLGVDLMTLAGHKFYAPKGIGALYVRKGVILSRVLRGALQERGLRPGTESVPLIVGLGEAAVLATERDWGAGMAVQADAFLTRLREGCPGIRLNGHPTLRLPNTLNLCFPGVPAARIFAALGDRVAVSAGSACHASNPSPSAVLKSMGLSDEEALSSIRFSLGRETAELEIEEAASLVLGAVHA